MSSQGFTADLNATLSLFAMLPEGAREEAREELHEIAVQAEAVQEQLVPRKSGFLAQGLTIEEALNALRARIGYPQIGGSQKQEILRHHHGIWPQGPNRAGYPRHNRQSQHGKSGLFENGEYPQAAEGGACYPRQLPLHVTSLDPRPFIHVEDRIDDLVDPSLPASGKSPGLCRRIARLIHRGISRPAHRRTGCGSCGAIADRGTGGHGQSSCWLGVFQHVLEDTRPPMIVIGNITTTSDTISRMNSSKPCSSRSTVSTRAKAAARSWQ
jgi:hypothetical protein